MVMASSVILRSRLRFVGMLVNIVNIKCLRCQHLPVSLLGGLVRRDETDFEFSCAARTPPDGPPSPPLPSRQPARSDPASGAQARRDRGSRRAHTARHGAF